MGASVDRDQFDEAEYGAFRRRLDQSVEALAELLERPGFGVGDTTIGAELEMFLIDDQAMPLPLNEEIRLRSVDSRVTLEVDRFDLEINANPNPLAGRPFTATANELAETLQHVQQAAASHGGRTVIGILPALPKHGFHRGALTDAARYRALDNGLRRLRHEPFRVNIDGEEPLDATFDNVSLEGANCSFQIHLRVDPDRFAGAYNAAQMAIAPVLAVAGNSPTFLGHRLWDETRIALFKQAVDDRDNWERPAKVARVAFGTDWVRAGALELFAQSVELHDPLIPVVEGGDPRPSVRGGDIPSLDELRLHHGTVWRWNRAIYDPGSGGHLRVEMRALAAGPTLVDMMANAAFLLGLTLALAPDADRLVDGLPFEDAHHNFYRAAQHGIDAQILWPVRPGKELRSLAATDLALMLLPVAQRALEEAGVDADEAGSLLGVIEERVATRQTGARWQCAQLGKLRDRTDRTAALAGMLERYLEHAAADTPVHSWPVR